MSIDLETGEVGNATELLIAAVKRRQERWHERTKKGLARVEAWKAEHPRRKVTLTRFYQLLHEEDVA